MAGSIGALTIAVLMCISPAMAQTAVPSTNSLLQLARGVFKPLPPNMATPQHPITPQLVKLGNDLYWDPRLSADGTVSCARCHQPALYGSDSLPKARGVEDKVNPRRAPTVLNAALEFRVLWLGQRKDVEGQAMRAFLGDTSFGNLSYAAVIARINAIPGYRPLFEQAFPGQPNPVTPENLGRAVGAYERTLVTPAPFDRFLKGDISALTPEQRTGLWTFVETGCASCHNGVDVGGNSFRKFGVVEDYWKATGSKEIDQGRYAATHDPADMYVFKVAMLRNVAMIPPYFHDGSVATLPQAVRVMARVQLGKRLSEDQIRAIVSFLDSLTGPLPADFAASPVLPMGPYQEGP
ncbi:MAG TPA: cytochrome c peroxidase [Steroidobacteraceae bacterium]|nr:cytochrome c peroxidase [Steroidobacteraceae bacterium]